MPVDDGAYCPLPQAISHDDARAMFNKVKKEMPGLSPAAVRREAARRMGTDYDTFLAAWKKQGPPKMPKPGGGVGSAPTPPPTGGVLSKEAARAAEREAAKKYGLKPGSAAARKKAAEDLGMTYDDFLQAWKGVKAKPTPTGAPGNAIPNAPVVLKPTEVVPETVDGIEGLLKKNNVALSGRNQVLDNAGILVSIHDPVLLARAIKVIEDAGFKATKVADTLYRVSRPLKRSKTGPVRRLSTTFDEDRLEKLIERGQLTTPNSIKNELRKQLTYTTDKINREFRGVLGRDFKDPQYFDKAGNQATLAYYRPTPTGGRYITMGKRPQTKGFNEAHYDMQRGGWFSRCTHGDMETGDGVKNVLAHEFGHFVDDLTRGASASKRAEVLGQMIDDLDLDSLEVKEFTGWGDFKSKTLKRKIAVNVSRYGATSLAEFMAEVWAEYSRAGDNARPHIKAWGTLIQDLMESMT